MRQNYNQLCILRKNTNGSGTVLGFIASIIVHLKNGLQDGPSYGYSSTPLHIHHGGRWKSNILSAEPEKETTRIPLQSRVIQFEG